MLVALEGSSPTIQGENNYKYYVWEIYQNTLQSRSLYIEGPAAISWSPSGVNIRTMSDEATAFINASPNEPVYLVGWSRGAAACVQVALDLNSTNRRRIEAMFLFDAVDQDGSTDYFLNYIPGNVANAYHAIATNKGWMDRQIFPTCAQTTAPSVNLVAERFHATHGGIAGAGETDGGSREFMWPHLRSHGVIG
jgi:pimeloyl-ACP methyl ester carboxylesterase